MDDETYIERVIDTLIALQDKVIDTDPFYKRATIEGEGRVGILEILGNEGGAYKYICENNRIKRYEGEGYLTKITMSEDTFIDLFSGEADLDDEYARRRVKFSGKDWTLHAENFKQGFKHMRHLWRLIGRVKRAK